MLRDLDFRIAKIEMLVFLLGIISVNSLTSGPIALYYFIRLWFESRK